MKWYYLLLIAAFALVVGVPEVQATYSVSTNQSSYRVGETITVNVCTDGGKVGLTLSGPYTINVNLGDLPQGCYSFQVGQAEQKDVGSWTIVMTNDSSISAWTSFLAAHGSNPPNAYFTVFSGVPEFSFPAMVLGIALAGSLIMTKSRRRVVS